MNFDNQEKTQEGPFTPIDEGGLDGEIGDGEVSSNSAFSRLLDGNITGPTVDTLKSQYSIAYHWALALRGVIRAATGEGVPPLWEITVGSLMGVASLARGEEDLGDMGDMGSLGGGNDEVNPDNIDPDDIPQE
jgi:hypothetical protein